MAVISISNCDLLRVVKGSVLRGQNEDAKL